MCCVHVAMVVCVHVLCTCDQGSVYVCVFVDMATCVCLCEQCMCVECCSICVYSGKGI